MLDVYSILASVFYMSELLSISLVYLLDADSWIALET